MTTTIPLSPDDAVVDIRPGDQEAAQAVEEWLQDHAANRDPRLRERIILAYLGLADRLAGRFRDSRGTSADDLRQTARAGLIAAVDRYDPGYATPFVPYAVACVVGELKRHLRDTSWRLQVPRPLKERALPLCRVADELHQHLGRSSTADRCLGDLVAAPAATAVLPGPGPGHHRGSGRLLPAAHLAPAAPGPGPHARSPGGALTE